MKIWIIYFKKLNHLRSYINAQLFLYFDQSDDVYVALRTDDVIHTCTYIFLKSLRNCDVIRLAKISLISVIVSE